MARKKSWSRQPRPLDAENDAAREVYERDRARRNLRLVPTPRKRKRVRDEEAWAAQSGPVRVRKGDA